MNLRGLARRAAGLGLVLLSLPAAAQTPVRPDLGPPVIASAPRPTDFLPPAFHRGRREALRQLLPAGSVAVLFAAPPRNRANDVDYKYHQHPDFYYLTGYEEPEAVLVLFKEPQTLNGKSGITEALYVRPRDPARELWTGRRLGVADSQTRLGLQYVAENKEFLTSPLPWNKFSQVLFLPLPDDVRDDPSEPADLASLVQSFRRQSGLPADFDDRRARAYAQARAHAGPVPQLQQQLEQLAASQPSIASDPYLTALRQASTAAAQSQALAALPNPRYGSYALDQALDQLRETKQPEELTLLRRAIQVSTAAQREVWKTITPEQGELAVQGLHEYLYRRFGAEFEGYPSIVGGGANACVLHYVQNDRPVLGPELLLMDCGAEYHGYSADVTRTVPPTGTFSPAQRQIYDLVLAAQEAGIRECRAGRPFFGPGQAAQKVVADGLLKLGIIQDKAEMRRYFPHGTSHYLGLDVHDRGTYGPLRPGTVLTVEPGIYIPAGSPCDPKWWNIGVRIEDDILITEKGSENLSAGAPRTAPEIEKVMAEPSVLEGFKLPELR